MKSLYNKHQKDHLSLCRKCFIIWEELMNVALIKMLTLEKMLASAQFSNTEVHVTCFQTTAHDGFGKFILTLKSRIFSLECCKEDLINFRSVDSKVKDELRDLAIEKPFVKALPYLQYGPFVVVLTNGAPQLLDRHTINVSRAVFGNSASGSLTFLGRLFDSKVRHFTEKPSDELDSMREMFPEEVALYGLETVTITNDLLKQHKNLWKRIGLGDISNKLEEKRLVFGSRVASIVGSSHADLHDSHEKALHIAFNLKNSAHQKWESWLKVRSSEWDQLHFSAYDAQNFELKFLISSCCKDLGPSKWIVQNRIGFCKCTNCRNDRTIENAAGLFCCQRLFDDDVDSERSRHLKKHFPNDLKCLAEHYFEAERVLPQPKRLRKRYELQRMKIYFNDINDFLYNGVKGNKSTLDKHLPLCFLAKVREKVNVERYFAIEYLLTTQNSRAEAIEEHFWPVSPRPYDSQQFWRRKLVSIQAATKEKKFNVFRHPIESEFYKNQNGDLYKAISFAIFDNYVTHFAEKLKGKVDEIIADDSSLTPLDVIPSILTLRLIVHRCVDPDHETYEWARYPGTVDKKTQKYPSVLLKEDKTAYYAIENLIDTVDV